MFKPQKLHPISYVSGFFTNLKQNILPLVIAIGLIATRGLDNIGDLIIPLCIILFSLIGSVFRGIKIFYTRYWIENNQLIVTWGVFSKNRKELNIERIQSVDTSQNFVHQLLGGVSLSVITPSDGVELDTITKKQSEQISKYLKEKKLELKQNDEELNSASTIVQEEREETSKPEKKEKELYFQLSTKSLMQMSFTSGGIFIVFAALSSLMGLITQFLDIGKIISPLFEQVVNFATVMIILSFIFILLSYIIGSLIVFIRYYKYNLTFDGELLTIKYGLFTVKKRSIPIKRIQALKEEESLFRRIFGFTSISAIITSDGSFEKNEEDNIGDVVILPFIKKKQAYDLLEEMIPQFEFSEVDKVLPKQGIRRRVFIPTIFILAVTIPIQIYLWSYVWIVGLALFIILMVYALVETLKSGYKVLDDSIVILNASPLRYTTTWVNRDKILTFMLNENPIIKRQDIAHFDIHIAYGHGMMSKGLKFINKQDALKIYSWYSNDGGVDHAS